uniref:NADH dehydrogenase subunit 6 n=1 Tax=Panagrolaimus sp. ES5 TaxID=591445 RepID=A0AC34FK63_9BILA
MAFSTGYLSTNRGIIKILQIIAGIIMCSFLCANTYEARSCFGESRVGYTSGLNFVVLIINVVLFILGLLSLNVWKLEHIYSIICTILFAISCGLFLWMMIQYNSFVYNNVITTIFLFVQTLLFLWDVKILSGESPN